LPNLAGVEKMRYCGTIAAFELPVKSDYGSELSRRLRDYFLAKGLIVRPVGNVIYFLPPFCITGDELGQAYKNVMQGLNEIFNYEVAYAS